MKYQICISAAAKGKSVEMGKDLAFNTGKAIAEHGHTLLTGATIGLPYYAACGAKASDGQSVGISPASSRLEHIRKYRLPTDMFDTVLYTGLNYVGRDTLLINCADAVIIIGGRLGTTHEFTVAIETGKPVAILRGAEGTSKLFDELMHAAGHRSGSIVEGDDPEELLKKLVKMLDSKYKKLAQKDPNVITGKPREGAIEEEYLQE